jgi:hypothetical protein
MSVERVTYADSRVYINNVLLTGISSCDINTTREFEPLTPYYSLSVGDRILKSDQKPQVTVSWILGEDSSDPFFDFQTEGILSVENFNIKKKDILGTIEVKSGFLTSYSLEGSVGSLITASAEYQGNNFDLDSSDKLQLGQQTQDYYKTFIPSKIELSASFTEGQIFSFPIQSFQLTVPIERKTIKVLGDLYGEYRYPILPANASISFSAIKNNITGLDFSKIVLEKGNFQITMKTCDENQTKTYALDNCSLIGISESLSIDEKALINFEYTSSITNNSFYIT